MHTSLGNLTVGDLVMTCQLTRHDASLGIIVMISNETKTVLYFIKWLSGFREGYTTAHKIEQIEQWQKNLKKNLTNDRG